MADGTSSDGQVAAAQHRAQQRRINDSPEVALAQELAQGGE